MEHTASDAGIRRLISQKCLWFGVKRLLYCLERLKKCQSVPVDDRQWIASVHVASLPDAIEQFSLANLQITFSRILFLPIDSTMLADFLRISSKQVYKSCNGD
jgi:hypothetical protein